MSKVLHHATTIGADLDEAARRLHSGDLVAMPTETVYGLAADALNPAAVARIFEVKNRPSFDPLIVHVQAMAAIEPLVLEFPAPARALAKHFWPGPLTLLLPKSGLIPDLVTSGLPRVGLRVPAHHLTLELLKKLPFPLAAPSANPFGYISPTSAQHVFNQLCGKISYILDGGPCRVGLESTIVGFEDGKTVVYRLGGIPVEAIEAVAGPVEVHLNQSSNPAAPGMLKSHYAPRKPLYIKSLSDAREFLGQKIGVLSWMQPGVLPEGAQCIALTKNGNAAEAAQNLFSALRALDQADIDLILAEYVPEAGLGRAINDRLRRAAADHTV